MNDFSQLTFPFKDGEMVIRVPYVVQIPRFILSLMGRARSQIESIVETRGDINYVVDVGGCVGSWAITYSEMFPKAEILTIEPSSYNYEFLEFNCRGRTNIKLLKMAAYNKTERVRIANPNIMQRNRADLGINTGMISVYGLSKFYAEMVDADTLDNIVQKKVDYLKIDVEGCEQAVLEGATRILYEDRPIMQIEMRADNQAMGPYTIGGLVGFIGDAKYTLLGTVDCDFLYVPSETM